MNKAWLSLILLLGDGQWLMSAEPTPQTEEVNKAIHRGLDYLALSQDKEGSWTSGNKPNLGVAGLAVMAFTSAGYAPGKKPYGEVVLKGIRSILQAQKDSGLIANSRTIEMYQHGICTLMLAEVVERTKGELADEVRKKLEKAVGLILKAQRTSGQHRGGWRYTVEGDDGDMSVTGWQLLALRAAKDHGVDVPQKQIELAMDYVKRCQDPASGGFRYMLGGRVSIGCTGTAILSLELWNQEKRSPESVKAGAYLIKKLPVWDEPHTFDTTYKCSHATFRLGGIYWEKMQPHIYDMMIKNQHPNGSWSNRRNSDGYGPNYGTAMSILSLTVDHETRRKQN